MSDWDNDKPVGFGNPPPWTRFRKGQSGNPKGRPKKKQKELPPESDSELDRIQRKVLNQKVVISAGGKTEQMKMQEAIIRSQATQAAKGHALAQRDVIRRAEELEKREARKNAERQDKAEQEAFEKAQGERRLFEYFAKLKKNQAKAWGEAQAQGCKEPDFPWPHPDDIMLDHGRQSYQLIGPLDGAGVPIYEFQRAERDVAFMRMMIALKARAKCDRVMAEFWALVFGIYDARMPKRWKIGEDFDLIFTLHFNCSMRELRAMLIKDEHRAARWKILSGCSEPCKEGYRTANAVMAPILQEQGYQSLAQFERAFEDTGGNPPWPRNRHG